jgi:hypothetical protein
MFWRDPDRFRRVATALSLIGAGVFTLVGMLLTPWEGTEGTGAYLQALADEPIRGSIAPVFLHYGFLLMVPGFLGTLRLLRERGVVLGHVGAILTVVGWATLSGILVIDYYDIALAENLPLQQAVEISKAIEEYPAFFFIVVPAFFGALLGPVFMAIALWRARFLPMWTPILLTLGIVVTQFGGPTLLMAGLGSGITLAALGYIGWVVLRMTDQEWAGAATRSPEVRSA